MDDDAGISLIPMGAPDAELLLLQRGFFAVASRGISSGAMIDISRAALKA